MSWEVDVCGLLGSLEGPKPFVGLVPFETFEGFGSFEKLEGLGPFGGPKPFVGLGPFETFEEFGSFEGL